MECTRHVGFVKGLEVICNDTRARRELLWLRARQRGDDAERAKLELLDPDLPRRVAWAEARFREMALAFQWESDREKAWARLYDVCLDAHVARLTGVPLCRCLDCRAGLASVRWPAEPARIS